MKKLFKRLALLALSLVLSLVLLEGLLSVFAWWKFGTVDVAELERIQTGNKDAAELDPTGAGDSAAEDFYPHPYLAFVRQKRPDQTGMPNYKRVNNVGMTGRDFPLRKDPTKFTVMLVGGSVARQFGAAGEGKQNYLEQFLNERYRFDRPVVVLNGGNSAWKEPQAAIVYLLYGEVADAVVSLDGFNEYFCFQGNTERLEVPPANFKTLNPVAQYGFGPLAAAWQAQQLRRYALTHRWRTVYFFTRALRRQLEETADEQGQGTLLTEIFSLPSRMSKAERVEFNLDQYKKYIRSIDKIALLNGSKSAHFIQPCPAYGKSLTPQEIQKVGPLDYRDTYRMAADKMMELRSEGISIADLGNVYEQTTETVYDDHIHCVSEKPKPGDDFIPSPGYRLMAQTIAKQLGEFWSLQPVESSASR